MVIKVGYNHDPNTVQIKITQFCSNLLDPFATVKPCGYCGRENDDGASHCAECGTSFVVETPEPEKDEPEKDSGSMSAFVHAILVPVLVVFLQTAWVVLQGWDFHYNALLAQFPHPVVLVGMMVVAAISFIVIRPFAPRTAGRSFAFPACVFGFTVLVYSLLPKLAE